MKITRLHYSILWTAVIILMATNLYFGLSTDNNQIQKLTEQNNLYKGILLLDFGWDESGDMASQLYSEAGIAYERQDYLTSESKCKLARDKYSKQIQVLKREEIETRNQTGKIFEIYIDMLKEDILINENMYEACEYFEEVSRHYAFYYKDTTPYDDASYEMAGLALEHMNDKIGAHDDAVRRYNYLLEEFNIEKEGIVNENE